VKNQPGKEKLSTHSGGVDNFFATHIGCLHLLAKLAWTKFHVQGIFGDFLIFPLTLYFIGQ
jgi:hypothetical protein